MKTKYTPAPWGLPHFANKGINCSCKYLLSNVAPICIATLHVKETDNIEDSEYPEFEEAVANAKLISCAPNLLEKLLEALEAIEWYMEKSTPENEEYQTFHDLGMNILESGKELIKKATE